MNAATPPALQVIILAAGFSSRLGRPKALARVRSLSLLRRTLALAVRCTPAKVIVVLPRRAARYRIEAQGFGVVFVVNSQRAAGLSSSVRCGLARARYSAAALLLPVDLAALRQRELLRLVARWRAARRRVVARRIRRAEGVVSAVLPQVGLAHSGPAQGASVQGGSVEGGSAQGDSVQGGVPLILPHWLYSRARGVTGDIGLRELIRGLSPQQRVLLHLPSAELDVDTPEDLRAARRRARYSRAFCTSR